VLAFFADVIRPLLLALRPASVVEIGSESGKTTQRLVELAAEIDAVVHSIDPAPGFDVEGWQAQAKGRLRVHVARSLDVIGTLARLDAVLIDGDHNWYTVHSELGLIERRAAELAQPLPLILLHDVCWPYGRRDLYYQPESIPAEHRQPYARRGISPTESELVRKGGINPGLCNALHEGGPRNGVLTAVDDYLGETPARFERVLIEAVFGLAILMPAELAARNPALARQVRAWAVPEVARFIGRLEAARIAMLTGARG